MEIWAGNVAGKGSGKRAFKVLVKLPMVSLLGDLPTS